ncbi:MAG TPA: SDR family NAD(P)-dependent oxidoreductase [Solirubrobacterales bacterium]
MGGALVTGAGRGLGLEIARGLVARGLTVHVTDVDGDAAAAAAAEVGGGAFASALDVRDPGACRAAAAATAERGGGLEVWVNNAGILATGLTWEQDDELRRAMLDVNAHGTMNGTIAALELMRPAGRGHIINIISLAGLVAAPGEALYGASKHAAIAFTIGTLADLRRSGERRIKISAVCPDGIWSPMLADKLDDPDAAPSFSGRLLSPEHVAARTVAVLDRPRVVLTIPRWRGFVIRLFDAFPGLAERMVPAMMADARRRQARWKRRIEAGETPR